MTQLTNVTRGETVFIAHVEGQPCSVNRMYGRRARATGSRAGSVYLTDAAAAWELAVAIQVRAQLDIAGLACAWREAGEPQIAVTLTFAGVRGDVDNYAKTTLDGLKQAIGIDDRRFSPVVAQRALPTTTATRRALPGAQIEIALPTVATIATVATVNSGEGTHGSEKTRER